MKGITFGQFHSYNDFALILNTKEIGSPEIKKYEIDVQGADGFLDFTDYFGEVKFGNRELKFEFALMHQADFLTVFTDIQNKLHGKKIQIILDEDSTHYYVGRVSISPFTNEKGIGYISIECDCEPYKYDVEETVQSYTVSGTRTIVLPVSRKAVVPTITTTASFTITQSGTSGTYSAGTFLIPSLYVNDTETDIAVSGSGTITFRYRRGWL